MVNKAIETSGLENFFRNDVIIKLFPCEEYTTKMKNLKMIKIPMPVFIFYEVNESLPTQQIAQVSVILA